jgi:hypothetical protein
VTDTNPTPEAEPQEKFWEVSFSIVTRKECIATVKAKTRAEAEAIVESLSSDVLVYGPSDDSDYHQTPTCEYEEETVEDVAAYGPLTEEDL